ncbi:MAG: starch-binding protein, partial [Ruminococcus sp.]|nr:starch-binding protein [Ruminococcus sp.]
MMTRKLISIVLAVCMIMSCFAVTGMSVSAATVSEATGAAQFKFTDAMNWGDIRLYAWDANQNAVTAQWPGNSGVQGQQNEYGQMVYTINVPNGAAGVIVNGAGGSKQTANITNFAPAGGGYYVDSSRTEVNDMGATVYTAIPWGGTTGSESTDPSNSTNSGSNEIRVSLPGDAPGSAWYAWTWDEGGQGDWRNITRPSYVGGLKSKVLFANFASDNTAKNWDNVLAQTADFTVQNHKMLVISNNKDGQNHYTGSWVADSYFDGGQTDPTTTVPASKNIYFAAPTTWSAVDFYYGNSTSNFNAATKLPMTKTDETVDVTISGLTTVSTGAWP